MATLFVSYKRGLCDDFVSTLVTYFRDLSGHEPSNNYDLYIDQDVIGGDDWWLKICENIAGRTHFVAILSRQYLQSPYCMEELHYAYRCSSIIVPVLVDPSLTPTELESELLYIEKITGNMPSGGIQVIDCSKEQTRPQELHKISTAIRQHAHSFHRPPPPFPARPVELAETIKKINEVLAAESLQGIDVLLSQLRGILNVDGHRAEIAQIAERLRAAGKRLSRQQYLEVEDLLKRLHADFSDNRRTLIEAADSLGISALYDDRHSAAGKIQAAISAPTTTEIALLGVSLNNLQRPDGEFHRSWNYISTLIEAADKLAQPLNVRLLIAHPHSLGSVLRSKGEQGTVSPENRRLTIDVNLTAEALKALQLRLKGIASSKITIEARLYMTAPIQFLCWTNSHAIMQPYYYWSSHSAASMPTFAFDKDTTSPNGERLHNDLLHHFNLIWDHASVDLDEYLVGRHRGIETGMYKSGAINAYASNTDGKERILYLLNNAQNRIWIQGITLFSYFGRDSALSNAFKDAVLTKKLDIKVLLLDPNCQQAQYRAYREYLIEQQQTLHEPVSFSEFVQEGLDRSAILTTDSWGARRRIEILLQRKRASDFQFRLYSSAPYCFLLIVDDFALVEQYHYGYEPAGQNGFEPTNSILGMDMPKIEYGPTVPGIFLPEVDISKRLITPSKLLEDHFEFAWNTAATPSSDVDVDPG